MNIGETLKEAARLVSGDRGRDYGDPHVCYSKAARILEVIAPHLRAKPSDIMLVFLAAKLARGSHRYKVDNVADMVAYLDFYASMKEEEDAMQRSAQTATIATWDTTPGTIRVNLPPAEPGKYYEVHMHEQTGEDWWCGPLCATPNTQGENPEAGSIFHLPEWTEGMSGAEIIDLLERGRNHAPIQTCTPEGSERSEEEPDYSIWIEHHPEASDNFSIRMDRGDRSIEESQEREWYFYAKREFERLVEDINERAKRTKNLADAIYQIRKGIKP